MIIKKPHIIILLLLFARMAVTVSFAQVTYFQRRYDLNEHQTWDYGRRIIKTNSGYVIQGETGPTHEFMDWHRIGLTAINLEGDQLWKKDWGDTISEYFLGYSGSLIQSLDNSYYATGVKRTATSNGVHDEGMLIKYNSSFDTIWSRFYGELCAPYDTEYMFQQVKQIENGDLIILGGFYPYSATKVYLLKTNSIGKPLWDKIYYYGYFIYPWSIEETTDKGFIIGGVQSGGYQDVDPILIKTDSAGNQQWMKKIGSPFAEYCSTVTISMDSNIVAGAIWADSALSYDNYWGRVHIVKMDNAGNVIWDKKYGSPHIGNRIHNIRCLADGSIIATGYYDRYLHYVGWILKTNSEGDSLWMRQYDLLQVPESYNGLFDIIATDDGGYIACGDVWPYPPDTGTQDVWVVKMDSIGCPYPECDTTVGIIPLIPPAKTKLNVYPNPAGDFITIDYEIKKACSNINCSVTTMDGKTVIREKLNKEHDQKIIYVKTFQQGDYLITLYSGNSVLSSQKFTIKR